MSVKAVCFDLGGVLVRICTAWQQAATLAGIPWVDGLASQLDSRPEFNLYQSGLIEDTQYLEALASVLNVGVDRAKHAHQCILIEPYAGTFELVQELESKGVTTGCLSNTNALHWREMVDTDAFPAVKRLQVKTASHLVRSSKPEPAIYGFFERASGMKPDEILNFDDVPTYVEAARQQGWNSVQIDPNGDTASQIRRALQTFGLL